MSQSKIPDLISPPTAASGPHIIRPSNFVPGLGNAHARIVIVGEAPGYEENLARKPFVGASGQSLDSTLKLAGLNRGQLWITNVVKFQPPGNDFTKLASIGVDIAQQTQFLYDEIRQINPNVVVALGEQALLALTGHHGIMMWRGSILKGYTGHKVIPTFHPAFLLRSESLWQKSVSVMDLARAKEEATSPDLNLPRRNLIVCYDSGTLGRFCSRYSDRTRYPRVSVDIETIDCIPVCVSLSFVNSESIAFPLLNEVWGMQLCTTPLVDLAYMWQILQEALKDRDIIGQNFKYDQPKLENLGFRMDGRRVHDTMVMFHTLYPEMPKSLQMITSLFTREPYYKDEGKTFNPKKDKFDQFLLYNAKDTAVTLEGYEQMMETLLEERRVNFYNLIPQRLHSEYSQVEREGILVDQDQRELLTVKYEIRWEECQRELDALVDVPDYSVNVNSSPQMKKLFTERWKLPLRKKYDEESLYALSANYAKRHPSIERVIALILEIRQIRKTLGTYLKARPDYDGRMRTSYRIVGTETGRTSTSILKRPVRREKIGLAFQTMTKHGDVGADIRSMLIPDEGYVFLECDQSQAEARVVALLANDFELLAKFGRIDIHCETAVLCLGLEPFGEWYEELVRRKKAGLDPPERFIGKTFRHAGNYDMGKRRAMLSVNTDAKKYGIQDVNISEYRASQFLERFHNANPKIKRVFHAEVQRLLRTSRRLVNPFGRVRDFFGKGDNLDKEGYAFIPQSTVGDQTKLAMIRTREEIQDLRTCMESHDAFTALVPKNEVEAYAKVIQKHMENPIDFATCSIKRGVLVIPSEFQVGEHNLKNMVGLKL